MVNLKYLNLMFIKLIITLIIVYHRIVHNQNLNFSIQKKRIKMNHYQFSNLQLIYFNI